jgi:hypothetical protein
MLDCFHADGTFARVNDLLKRSDRGLDISEEHSFNNLLLTPSAPFAFPMSRELRIF